jgi:DNA repair protein RecN (Recombination protein N)
VAAELSDIAADLRTQSERIEPDPERLEAIRQRRNTLRELCRKYGDTLADVIAFATSADERLQALEAHDARAAAIDEQRTRALERVARAEAAVKAARTKAAPALASATQSVLADLAMANATLDVLVDGDAGEQVAFLLAANPGAPLLPLAKVASGGELARAMLALRLVSGEGEDAGPGTVVFDEVDAGIGGGAAIAVGRALAEVARHKQVLVVTHLPQVAAHADNHLGVTKRDDGASTTATVRVLDRGERVEELARMLSGSPDSETAREHARELLDRTGIHGPAEAARYGGIP